MRWFITLCTLCSLICLGSAAYANNSTIVFDGNSVPIKTQQWQILDTNKALTIEELAPTLNHYAWAPLGDTVHIEPYGHHFLKADLKVTYTGEDRIMLVIPHNFDAQAMIGVVHQGELLFWEDVGIKRESEDEAFFILDFTRLPISQPGEYQLIAWSQVLGSTTSMRAAKIMREDTLFLHYVPSRLSITIGTLGAVGTYWFFSLVLLLFHFRPRFLLAVGFISGAFATLLIREGVLFLRIPNLNIVWWTTAALPFAIAITYSSLLFYIFSHLKRSRLLKLKYALKLCAIASLIISPVVALLPVSVNPLPVLMATVAMHLGFFFALILLLDNLYKRSLEEVVFSVVMMIAVLVISAHSLATFQNISEDSTLVAWYMILASVSGYVFINYLIEVVRHYLSRRERKAVDLTRFDMVSRFSHELRTPLNAVIGLTDLLQESQDVDKVKSYAKMIQNSGHSLLGLVNDILDFSKMRSTEVLLEKKPFRVDEISHDIANTFLPLCMDKQVYMQIYVEPDTPLFVLGDELRLKQILSNLASNAVKFSSEGGLILISFAAGEKTDTQTELRVSVTDTGRGIPQDKLNTIFEPFTQVDAIDGTLLGGTGLGLTICKFLVEQMNGEISVSSDSKGTTFKFNVWLEQDPQGPDVSTYLQALKGKRMLVVSADSMMTNTFITSLQHWGMEVDKVNHYNELHKPIDTYDIMVTDTLRTADASFAPWINTIPASVAVQIYEFDKYQWVDALQHKNLRRIPVPRPILNTWMQITEHLTGNRLELPNQEVSVEPAVDLSHHHVLLVDDSPVNLMVAGKLLESIGVRYSSAAGGLEALDKLQDSDNHYSLVLLDCEMPDLDGFEVCRRWRAFEAKQQDREHLTVIALTAHALNEVKNECLASGMDDVAFKPMGKEALLKLFRKLGKR